MMPRLIDAYALVDALMPYTWRNEDERLIDDADEKREYIKQWLPDLPTVGGWISVKDRLPEEDTDVLVWNRLGIEIAAYTTNPVKRWYSYNGQEVIAIYWMPLPSTEGLHET